MSKKKEDKEIYRYQTVASTNENYTPHTVINQYTTIDKARTELLTDIKAIKEQNEDFKHFGIRQIPEQE